jgi:hypothetical protein
MLTGRTDVAWLVSLEVMPPMPAVDMLGMRGPGLAVTYNVSDLSSAGGVCTAWPAVGAEASQDADDHASHSAAETRTPPATNIVGTEAALDISLRKADCLIPESVNLNEAPGGGSY